MRQNHQFVCDKASIRERINEILHNDTEWARFINEIFHHTLRLLEAPCQVVNP